VNFGLRIFYQTDLKPWIRSVYEEIHSAYAGPGWRHINGYARLGRFVCGTALILIWIVLCVATACLFFGFLLNVFEAIACLFNANCTISFRPPY